MSAVQSIPSGPSRQTSRAAAATDAAAGALAAAPRETYPLLLLHLRGDQAAMGEQHGRLLREVGGYDAVLDYYPQMPARLLLGAAGELEQKLLGVAARPLLDLLLRRLEARRPPEYRARARAFFSALGRPASTSRQMFVMDLLQNVVGLAGRFEVGGVRRIAAAAAIPACSSIAVWGQASPDERLRHARNFDFPGTGLWERWPAVVLQTPDVGLRYGFVTTRGADVPGVTAFNEAGLTVTCHTKFHRDVRFDGMGIVDLGHEIVRRAETLADALAVARERPVASSWGLVVSSARERRACVLEVHGRHVEARFPNHGEDFLAQANRYQGAAHQRGEVAPSPAFVMNSLGRQQALERAARVAQGRGGLAFEDLARLLGSREDPDVPGAERLAGGVLAQGISVQSVVCSPEEQRLHVSVGPCPTGRGPWLEVPWSWDEPVGRRALAGAEAVATAGAEREGYQHLLRAGHLQEQGASRADVAGALEDAVRADPDEPSYRLLAAGAHLRQGDARAALDDLRQALTRERSNFYRGQLMLWAARAADAAGEPEVARAYRAELEELRHPLLSEYQAAARREARRPLSKRRLRGVGLNLHFPELVV